MQFSNSLQSHITRGDEVHAMWLKKRLSNAQTSKEIDTRALNAQVNRVQSILVHYNVMQREFIQLDNEGIAI